LQMTDLFVVVTDHRWSLPKRCDPPNLWTVPACASRPRTQAKVSPRRSIIEPINPSVWRRASRNTALNVSALRIASAEYQRWPPRGHPRCRSPSHDRFLSEPDRQAPTLAQARVVGPLPRVLGRPVRHLALPLWDMVAAVGIGLERHRGFRISRGPSSYLNAAPIPTADPCNTASSRARAAERSGRLGRPTRRSPLPP